MTTASHTVHRRDLNCVLSCFRGCLLTAAVALSACAAAPQTSKTPTAGSEMPRSVVDPYLKIHAALSDDTVEGVRTAAGDMATAATALGAPAMTIDTAALQLASATELEDARTKFGVLSEAMEAYMNGLHLTPPAGVKTAFCPMVLKPWLQADATITNPYYGKDMLTCGNFK